MSKKKRKNRFFYIDTNVAIDFATNRDIQTVTVLEMIRGRGWKCVSSTFLAMEMADYKQDYVFIAKELNKQRDPTDILRSRGNKNLGNAAFQEIEEWFKEFTQRFKNLTMYDFIHDANGWTLARDISFSSNISAPDVLHLTSAILGSKAGYCDTLITKDGTFQKEAEKILTQLKLRTKLRVMSPSEVRRIFFPKMF
ncbi:MAG TPA: hypothetical protein VI215_00905 [Bacteroidota bacterium]|jgi:hypothetical protein